MRSLAAPFYFQRLAAQLKLTAVIDGTIQVYVAGVASVAENILKST